MESLSGMWEKFSLLELEGRKLIVEENEDARVFFLADRFFIGRALSMEVIAQTFKLLWRTRKGFEVRDKGNHLFFFFGFLG